MDDFQIPILFIIFNKLDTTKEVFEKIKEIKPERLYISCDGAREEVQGEKERVEKIKKYVLENINWNCQVKTLFQEENLGCRYAPFSAISWFFENEEMGIILEDDCLPSKSFFYFCEECLWKYKDEEKVMQINGISFLGEWSNFQISESYFFSKYNHIWGWASWRRAWEKYEMESLCMEKDFENLEKTYNSSSEKKYWNSIFEKYMDKSLNKSAWDYPWTFSIWKNGGMCIYPKCNMVRNIGIGHEAATHTLGKDLKISNMKIWELDQIKHPKKIEIDKKLDRLNYDNVFKPLSFLQRVKRKVYKIILSKNS